MRRRLFSGSRPGGVRKLDMTCADVLDAEANVRFALTSVDGERSPTALDISEMHTLEFCVAAVTVM
jgi:hypothetical protein